MVNIRHSYGLRTHPCGGAPHPGYVVFHTQTALLGWGTTSVVLSMPDDMPPLGWGITLVDGGQSRQRDKQYAPMFRIVVVVDEDIAIILESLWISPAD